MPLTDEQREQAYVIKHEAWNRAKVFLGPDGEAKAHKYVVDQHIWDVGEVLPWMDDKSPAGYEKTFEYMAEHGYLDNWDIVGEARIEDD